MRPKRRGSAFAAIVVLAAGFAALGAAGCAGIAGTESFSIRNPFRIVPERPLADVPVPTGFTYRKSASWVFNGNYRVARLEYRGTPHVEECASYFLEQMPQNRWSFVADSGKDDRVMKFRNESEEMQVTLARMSGVTRLAIEIKPRPI